MTPLNAGAVQLAEICAKGTVVAIAAKIQRTEAEVRHYKTGRRTPTDEIRTRLFEAYGIPIGAWDMPASAVEPAPSNAATPPQASRGPSLARAGLTSRDRAAAIVERIEAEIAACDASVPVNHKAALFGQLQSACAALSKLDGDHELTPGAVLRSRAWRQVSNVLESVLRKYPGAAEDLRDQLATLPGAER